MHLHCTVGIGSIVPFLEPFSIQSNGEKLTQKDKTAYNPTKLRQIFKNQVFMSKGVGTGGARGAMAPTLLKTVDFGPPTFQ